MIKKQNIHKFALNDKVEKVDDETRRLYILLEQTRTILYTMLEDEEKHHNTDYTEIGIIYYLLPNENGLTQNDLVRYVMKKQNSISVRLDNMEKKGLIIRVKNNNNRKTYAKLTPLGRDLWNSLNERSISLTFSVLSEKEKQQLKPILIKLRNKARSLLGLDYKPPYFP
ncbi:MAG: MarR family transcriptional regulator [Dehalococcoidales bacterium]|nr:MarR family transcriptional regulator [Dehalococcoidales bacterium]